MGVFKIKNRECEKFGKPRLAKPTSFLAGLILFSLLCLALLIVLVMQKSPAEKRYEEVKQQYQSIDSVVLAPMDKSLVERFAPPIDWSYPEVDDPTIFIMHTFRYLDVMFVEWIDTGESGLEDAIIGHMLDYLHYGSERTQEVYYAWSDDSVARRVFRLSYWGYVFQDSLSEEDKALLKETLSEQAEMLTRDDFYNRNHNHGMFQDMGLIAYALFWEEDEAQKDRYLTLAKTRSEEYFDYVFTEEGIHKEHSPAYGRDVACCLLFYKEVYRGIDPAFSEKCEQLYSNCGDYFAALTMPNGQIPSVGDSEEFSLDDELWPDNQGYQWVVTGGKQGVCPPDDMIFPESGYATFRSSWEDSAEEGTYLLFTAATYSSTHKHSDDLNFILYHGGDLFVEAGKKDYNYTDEQTRYVYSNYAHNVMLVDGEGFPVRYAESGAQRIRNEDMELACATQITSYDLEADVKWVQGIQQRYNNATQLRTIAYDKAREIVQITDSVEAVEELQTQFLYHIAPGVDIEEHDAGWILSRDGVVAANVYVSSGMPIELETITDSAGTAPYYTTTYYNGNGPEEGSLLIVSMACAKGDNDVCVTVELSPQTEPTAVAPSCQIDKSSLSAVIKEIPKRPYGSYYIATGLNGNELTVENIYTIEGADYSFEVFDEAKENRLAHRGYHSDPRWEYTFEEPGSYYIKAWIRTENEEKLRTYSRVIEVPG